MDRLKPLDMICIGKLLFYQQTLIDRNFCILDIVEVDKIMGLFYSSTNTIIPAHGKAVVPTDLSICVPEGTYGRVAPRSGLGMQAR